MRYLLGCLVALTAFAPVIFAEGTELANGRVIASVAVEGTELGNG